MKKVCLLIGDRYTKITQAPPKAWPVIRNVCRARPDGFQFMPKYKKGYWDGYISLMRGVYHFPTGLLDLVINALNNANFVCKPDWPLTDLPLYPLHTDGDVHTDILDTVVLRDYQEVAVNNLLDFERGIAKMATNAGKTVVFAAIIKYLGNKDALVIVQSKDLLYQTAARLSEYLGRTVGLIGDSHQDDCDICVATIQTLDSLRSRCKSKSAFSKLYQNNKILVVDECHHIAHNKTFDILMEIPGWYRYGFSGTPLFRGKLDDLKLIACTGEVVVNVTNADLIEQEWSAVPIISMHDVPETKVDYWEAKYPTAYKKCITEHYDRNKIIRDLALEEVKRGPVLVIVNHLKHGDTLLKMIAPVPNVDVRFVHGSSSMDRRKDTLMQMGFGEYMIVIATIFEEGVDVPALDSVILAAGGKSRIKLLQRIGRGLRRKEGENIVHIHDFIDSNNEYLLNHTEERVSAYKAEGFQVNGWRGDN